MLSVQGHLTVRALHCINHGMPYTELSRSTAFTSDAKHLVKEQCASNQGLSQLGIEPPAHKTSSLPTKLLSQ